MSKISIHVKFPVETLKQEIKDLEKQEINSMPGQYRLNIQAQLAAKREALVKLEKK